MAHIDLPHDFTNGTAADAEEVDANFNAVTAQVNGNLDESNVRPGSLSHAVAAFRAVRFRGTLSGDVVAGSPIDLYGPFQIALDLGGGTGGDVDYNFASPILAGSQGVQWMVAGGLFTTSLNELLEVGLRKIDDDTLRVGLRRQSGAFITLQYVFCVVRFA